MMEFGNFDEGDDDNFFNDSVKNDTNWPSS